MRTAHSYRDKKANLDSRVFHRSLGSASAGAASASGQTSDGRRRLLLQFSSQTPVGLVLTSSSSVAFFESPRRTVMGVSDAEPAHANVTAHPSADRTLQQLRETDRVAPARAPPKVGRPQLQRRTPAQCRSLPTPVPVPGNALLVPDASGPGVPDPPTRTTRPAIPTSRHQVGPRAFHRFVLGANCINILWVTFPSACILAPFFCGKEDRTLHTADRPAQEGDVRGNLRGAGLDGFTGRAADDPRIHH